MNLSEFKARLAEADSMPAVALDEGDISTPPANRSTSLPLFSVVDQRSRCSGEGTRVRVASTRDRLDGIRANSKKKDFLKAREVSEVITAEFTRRGALYDDGSRTYVFLKDSRVLLPIGPDEDALCMALFDYGLFPQDRLTTDVIDALRYAAKRTGQRTEVHALSFYDRHSCTAYIYDFAGGVFVVAPSGVRHCDNGIDGHLFIQNPKWEPINIIGTVQNPIDWQKWLLNGIQFATGDLDANDSGFLLRVWVLSLYFPQLFPTRPILALTGEKGCGKSSLLRRLGQMLFGPRFNITAMTAKPDDFDALVTTDPLVIADNADKAPSWLEDRLAVIATGGTIQRRSYYTTNKLVDFPIRATVGITSRTPEFRREDVAERLVPLKLERITTFGAENELLADVQRLRQSLLTAIIGDVYRAVCQLEKQKSHQHVSATRLADFASFATKVGPVLGMEQPDVDRLFNRLSGQQVAFVTQDDPLFELVRSWLAKQGNVNREVSSTELMSELESLAPGGDVPWAAGNPRSFAAYTRDRAGTLRSMFSLRQRTGHAGASFLTLGGRLEPSGAAGDSGDESPLFVEQVVKSVVGNGGL
ncbi:MAG: hypothetical protein K1X67_20375 [Fimbriimonadaceae bacterium]|nr:hypothetical protein [Fimbriimonadaceae bacterium]